MTLRRLAHGVGVVIAAAAWLGAPSASARRWVLQPSPRTPLLDSLDSVACPSSRECMAVGSDFILGSIAAERWDGGLWKVIPMPTPPAATDSELNGVSCARPNDCEAVGFSETGSVLAGANLLLDEHWDGVSWTLRSVPTPGEAANLTGVSCATADACVAVGSWGDGLGEALFAERWDGRRWSPVRMRTPAGGQAIEINAVSCPAANACIAVGGFTSVDGFQAPLAERWNGRSWLIENTIDPNRRAEATLRSVSCSSRRECVAVGDFLVRGAGYQVPVAEQRNGGLWALYSLPGTSSLPLRPASLTGVSCLRGGPCSAVGTIGASGPGGPGGQTLAERWSGLGWSVALTPSPAPSDALEAVSCPTPAMCVAVGAASDMAGNDSAALIERLS